MWWGSAWRRATGSAARRGGRSNNVIDSAVRRAALDDRGRAVAAEGATRVARASKPPPPGLPGRSGADRRFAARLVRGPGAAVRADRVCGRRDVAAAGDGVLAGGDD